MAKKRVMAFDPGPDPGWAYGTYDDEAKTLVVENYGYDPWKATVLQFHRVMEGPRPFDIVVYESWRLRSTAAREKSGSDFPEIQCIGAIKLACWAASKRPALVTSEPAYKPVIDRQMGGTDYLPPRMGVEHHRDAVRHLCWLAVNRLGVLPENISFAAKPEDEDA